MNRRITTLALVLFLTPLAALTARPQACGRSFVDILVLDSEDKNVPGVIVELLAEVPSEEYRRLEVKTLKNEAVVKLSEGNGTAIKISAKDADEIIKRNLPMSRPEDFCGNPLRLVANSTKVTRSPAHVEGREFSIKNFGFCTVETYSTPSLLKVSAPGYVTDYYVGPHLVGCRRSYKIVLTRKK
jgi:hypothetical protein